MVVVVVVVAVCKLVDVVNMFDDDVAVVILDANVVLVLVVVNCLRQIECRAVLTHRQGRHLPRAPDF